MLRWSTIDTPWLILVAKNTMAKICQASAALSPEIILSSHLPPVTNHKGLLQALMDSVVMMKGADAGVMN